MRMDDVALERDGCARCAAFWSCAQAAHRVLTRPPPRPAPCGDRRPPCCSNRSTARLTSGYGPRSNPVLKRKQMHRGIDWAAPRGTPVRAAGNGVVVAIERSGAYGRYVEIDHGGDGGHRLRSSAPLRVRPARRPPGAPGRCHRSDRQQRSRHRPAPALRGPGRRPADRPVRRSSDRQRAGASSGRVRAPGRGRRRTRHRRAHHQHSRGRSGRSARAGGGGSGRPAGRGRRRDDPGGGSVAASAWGARAR